MKVQVLNSHSMSCGLLLIKPLEYFPFFRILSQFKSVEAKNNETE